MLLLLSSMLDGEGESRLDQSLFATRIRAIRHALGMTQAEFAETVGVTREHVGRWESGKVGTTARRIELICHQLGMTEAQFWDVNYLPKARRGSAEREVTCIEGELPFPWPAEVAEAKELLPVGAGTPRHPLLPDDVAAADEADFFWIRVENDAMAGAGIGRGDTVLIRRQERVEQGGLALVRVDARNYCVRRVQYEGDFILLIPANEQYQVQLCRRDEVEIVGRVRRILKHV